MKDRVKDLLLLAVTTLTMVAAGTPTPAWPQGSTPPGDRPNAIQKITSRLVPLGVPMATTLEAEEADRDDNERQGTAAFKVRLALPGSFGEELTAKVQSLRALPEERYLGQENVGAAVAMPGGPGWPETEVVVTLRRIGTGGEESPAPDPDVLDGESGRFGTVYNLYESEETILLLADPRARRDYFLQDVPGADETADEKGQCRRCDWPSYLPDPKGGEAGDPELENVKELLAGGRYLRAFLFPSTESSQATKERTEAAIAYFDAMGRLIEMSDRHRRGAASGEQGNTMTYHYDPFGQLAVVTDDLGRKYRFEYHDDPRPESEGGDGGRYGLLKKITDFVGRTVEYEYGENRTLEKVLLPEVENPLDAYADFSYVGQDRPTIEYRVRSAVRSDRRRDRYHRDPARKVRPAAFGKLFPAAVRGRRDRRAASALRVQLADRPFGGVVVSHSGEFEFQCQRGQVAGSVPGKQHRRGAG